MTLLLNSLKDKISARLKPGDTIVVGVSGGPDSVFLLYFLVGLGINLNIIVCHVNYHLRGRAANQDQKFVEKLAKKQQFPFELLEAGPEIKKGNLENNCRDLRYTFFTDIRQKYQAKYILTAHHLNDQAETFLFNLVRGSNLKGFQSISEFDPQRHLFRPLLEVKKSDILEYLKEKKIPYRIDKSNKNLKFSRNLIRHQVIPQLEKLNPKFLVTFNSTLKNFQENLQLIENLTDNWLETNFSQQQFSLDLYLKQPTALQKNILRHIFKNLHQKSLTTATLEEIQNTLKQAKSNRKKEFGPGTFLKVIKDPKTQKRLVVLEAKLN